MALVLIGRETTYMSTGTNVQAVVKPKQSKLKLALKKPKDDEDVEEVDNSEEIVSAVVAPQPQSAEFQEYEQLMDNPISFLAKATELTTLDVVLPATFLTDSVGKVIYNDFKNDVSYFTGKSAAIQMKHMSKKAGLTGDYDFDIMAYKDGPLHSCSFLLYDAVKYKKLIDTAQKNKNIVINSVTFMEELLIESLEVQDGAHIVVFKFEDTYRALFVNEGIIKGVIDYDGDTDTETLKLEIVQQTRTKDYSLWKVDNLIIIEDLKRQLEIGLDVKGGGFGALYSFWKFNFSIKKI